LVRHFINTVLAPGLLPFLFDRSEIILHKHHHRGYAELIILCESGPVLVAAKVRKRAKLPTFEASQ
jgi:hypothetical protein